MIRNLKNILLNLNIKAIKVKGQYTFSIQNDNS